MRLQLLQRPLGYPEKLNEASGVLASMTLRDIRRHRCGRAADLGSQAVHFTLRKPLGRAIAMNSEFDRPLPDLEIPVGVDRLPVPFLLAPAIRYSLLAIRLLPI